MINQIKRDSFSRLSFFFIRKSPQNRKLCRKGAPFDCKSITEICKTSAESCKGAADECKGAADERKTSADECKGTAESCKTSSESCKTSSDNCKTSADAAHTLCLLSNELFSCGKTNPLADFGG